MSLLTNILGPQWRHLALPLFLEYIANLSRAFFVSCMNSASTWNLHSTCSCTALCAGEKIIVATVQPAGNFEDNSSAPGEGPRPSESLTPPPNGAQGTCRDGTKEARFGFGLKWWSQRSGLILRVTFSKVYEEKVWFPTILPRELSLFPCALWMRSIRIENVPYVLLSLPLPTAAF